MKRMNFTFDGVFGNNRSSLIKGCWSFLLVAFCIFLSTPQALAQPFCTLNADIGEVTDVSCFGDTDGSIDVNAEVSVSTLLPRVITYDWGPALAGPTQFNQDQFNLAPGNYSVTVTEVTPAFFIPLPPFFVPQLVHCVKILDATVVQPTAINFQTNGLNDAGCNGENTGQIYTIVSGGTPPYDYEWDGFPDTAPFGQPQDGVAEQTTLYAGTYGVTVTDFNGCTAEINNIVIGEPTPVTVTIGNVQNADCQGNETGEATATAAGGNGGPYTYAWSNGDATATADDLHAGGYVVTATDASGCTGVAAVSISDPNGLSLETLGLTHVSCNGGNDGSASSFILGGTPPYTTLGTGVFTAGGNAFPGATVSFPQPFEILVEDLPAGQYAIAVLDDNGCRVNQSFTIDEPTQIIADVTLTTDALCNGSLDGTATVIATGGTTPYTYAWSNLQTAATSIGLAADTYTVTVTDANGCEAITTAIVGEPDPLLFAVGATENVTCNGGDDGNIHMNNPTGGTPPFNYEWTGGPGAFNGAPDNVQDAYDIPAGTYNVTVTDANGCSAFVNGINISEPSPVTVTIAPPVNADCAGSETGSAVATAAGGTGAIYNYAWSNGQNGTNQATATGLHAGGYSVTVTDENGCTAQASTFISDPNGLQMEVITSTQPSCNGLSDGSITLGIFISGNNGGTPPYTLVQIFQDLVNTNVNIPFTGNTLFVDNLSAGQYSFIVQDANGCFVAEDFTMEEPTLLIADVITSTDVSCNGEADGTATVYATGGTTPYTYLWNDPAAQTTATATGLTAGAYMVQVTDANGCVTFQTVTILEPAALSLNNSLIIDVTCNGGNDGVIFIQTAGGTAPYNYQWDGPTGGFDANPDNTEDAIGIPAGTYDVTVIDANGCTFALTDLVVGEPTLLTVSISDVVNADCIGNETGSALATAAGGTGPYTYAWSNGENTAAASNLHAGGYVVIATDANGCTASAAISITDPSGLLFGITESTDVSCNGGADGTATFGIIGGTPPYELFGYIGPNGQQVDLNAAPVPVVVGTVFPGLSAGLYAFFVRDANGCITANNIIIHEPTELFAEIIHQLDESCPDANDGEATVNATGGTTPYTYLWSASAGSQTTNIATNLPDGVHSVTVTDANGCEDVVMVNIITNDIVAPQFVTTIPGDETVECDAIPAPFVIIPAWHTTDNCTDAADIMVTYTETIINVVCPNTYTIKRKWEIKDEAGNTAFHIQKIYVQDTTKPTFTVPADVTIECDESTLPANTGDVTDQMDNCSAPDKIVVAYTDVEDYSGCGGYTGTITRTWTATDECNNVETKVQVITIEDTTKPVALCKAVTVELDANGKGSITVADIDNGSTDNCATLAQLTFALDKTEFTCADLGANTVTLSVTDPCGNTGTCEAIVTVEDNILPVITCPQDITVHLLPGECEEVISFDVPATDNCSVTVEQTGGLYSSGDAFPIGGPYVLTYKATDAADNMATCSFSVTVIEYVPTSNEMTCNSLVNVTLDGDCQALITADQILEGNNYGCYDDYIITITDANGNLVFGNILTLAHVNTTVEVSIENPDTGISCWGNIFVEDKNIPTFDCPADKDVYCNSETDPYYTGEPVLTSCELSYTATYEDEFVDYECDGADSDSNVRARITRTWTVTDDSGNSDQCVQIINILKPEIAEIVFPSDKDDIDGTALDCGDVAANPNLLTPAYTGYPQFKGKDVHPGGLCALSIGYEDESLEICTGGGSYEILRTWTIRDMCRPLEPGVNPIKHIQSIKVLDTTGPTIACPADLTVGTTSNSCTANAALPLPSITDDCSGVASTNVTVSSGVLVNGVLTGLELGTHSVTITATDDCGNESECTYYIEVVDNIAPIAICDEHTIAGIGTDGYAIINALTFDDGSYDNCSDLTYEVRKMTDNCGIPANLSFGPAVSFCCNEIGTTIMVELRVTDAAGNHNSCMVEVEVQDKIDPIIICPAPKTINCDDDPTNLGLTGEATATDNCSDVTPTYTDISNTVDCGNGTILRLWTATDDAGNSSSCIQTITVVKLDPFTIVDTECRRYFPINHITPPVGPHSSKDDVEWPCDIELSTCGLGLDPDDLYANGTINPITNQQVKLDARPTIFEGACDNVAMTHQDTELEFGGGDACLKILRKWIIIDWCQANENQDPTQPGPGVWHYTQVIKVVNSNDPIITPVNLPAIIENFEPNCGTAFAAFEITADDDCTAQSDLDVSWAFSSGATGTGFSATDALVNGSYYVTFTVNDQCGNEAELVHHFEVIDAKKPTPICIFGLSTVTMPNSGEVTLWASDFESGSSYDNCTPYGALEISFSPDVDDKYLTITCADIPADGLVPVQIWVTDAYGNQDFCSTFVSVLSAPGVCPNTAAAISGTIENEDQEVIEEVVVTLSDDNGVNMPVTTGDDGHFQFNGMTYGDYDVTPVKDINYLNGVTTYDLVLISKHILGIELLDSPYKVIAADANNSQTITSLDIVKLRALILHIDDELANNTSWRFVDQNYVFPSTINPWQEAFPEYVDLDGTAPAPVNFTALKVGDVNGSAIPNNLLGTDTRTFNGKLALQLDAAKVAAGEEFTVDFRAKDFNNIAGYQFTLGFDNNTVTFVDVTSNLSDLSAENFGLTKLNEGVITTSWNANKGVSMEDNEVLFTLTFRANAAVNVEDVLSINSRYTASEAYNGSDLFDVVLEFNGTEVANGFELYQNTPNPFKAETTIGFNMPQAGAVTLKVMDVAGRTLRTIEMDAAKGFNSVQLDRADLDATGVVYYQLETATETATKKMIIVD